MTHCFLVKPLFQPSALKLFTLGILTLLVFYRRREIGTIILFR